MWQEPLEWGLDWRRNLQLFTHTAHYSNLKCHSKLQRTQNREKTGFLQPLAVPNRREACMTNVRRIYHVQFFLITVFCYHSLSSLWMSSENIFTWPKMLKLMIIRIMQRKFVAEPWSCESSSEAQFGSCYFKYNGQMYTVVTKQLIKQDIDLSNGNRISHPRVWQILGLC